MSSGDAREAPELGKAGGKGALPHTETNHFTQKMTSFLTHSLLHTRITAAIDAIDRGQAAAALAATVRVTVRMHASSTHCLRPTC